jgi:hypothetical protein
MKILIISVPRSGSTSLAYNLKSTLEYNEIFVEPYLYQKHNESFISKRTFEHGYPLKLSKNSIVKTMSYQVASQYGKPKDFTSFISEWKKEFDKIILLSRKDKQEHFVSWVNLLSKQENGESVYKKWNITEIEGKLKNYNYSEFKPHRDAIEELSKLFNLPITYYEDLYGEDRNKSLEIIKSWKLNINVNKLNELSNPIYKLKQNKNII